MNPVLITLGNFEIRWYSVLILVAAIIAIIMGLKEGKKFHLEDDFLFNLAFWAIIVGIIGARLYYVAFNWEMYKNNLSDILKIWNGGLAIHGGIIFGALTVYLYCRSHNKDIFRVFDIFSAPLILAQAIGRWGNFFNQEAHGMATTVINLKNMMIPDFIIDGMEIGGIHYHPTFYYEFLWCIIGFVVIMIVRRLKYTKIGQQTCIYFMWYSFGRFFIESLRTDSLMLGGFKIAQVVSIVLFLIFLTVFIIISRKGKFEGLYNNNDRKTQYFN